MKRDDRRVLSHSLQTAHACFESKGYLDVYRRTIAAEGSMFGVGYDGSVRFYLFDERDPIVGTYRRVFPSLFASPSDMPSDIRAHLRYPEDLFTIQLEMYGTYQMKHTQVFYTKEDVWQRPREKHHLSDDVVVEPYYITASLPGESQAQFILMSPTLPARRTCSDPGSAPVRTARTTAG